MLAYVDITILTLEKWVIVLQQPARPFLAACSVAVLADVRFLQLYCMPFWIGNQLELTFLVLDASCNVCLILQSYADFAVWPVYLLCIKTQRLVSQVTPPVARQTPTHNL